ncbi:hypothetical protein [Frigoribacterium sp. NPDC087798]|uniref:hypothetical protein n=1 Tax=Frigoribacterium sp. NPDC087798 TaxID=3363993 RepID=UPI0038288A98
MSFLDARPMRDEELVSVRVDPEGRHSDEVIGVDPRGDPEALDAITAISKLPLSVPLEVLRNDLHLEGDTSTTLLDEDIGDPRPIGSADLGTGVPSEGGGGANDDGLNPEVLKGLAFVFDVAADLMGEELSSAVGGLGDGRCSTVKDGPRPMSLQLAPGLARKQRCEHRLIAERRGQRHGRLPGVLDVKVVWCP